MTTAESEHVRTSYYRWENQENARYYEIYFGRDFFDWRITLVWGRKGTLLGQVRHYVCRDVEEGRAKVANIWKVRERNGYKLMLRF